MGAAGYSGQARRAPTEESSGAFYEWK